MPFHALRYLALTLLLVATLARAEHETKHVDLVCNAKENLALVRFSISYELATTYPRLPQSLDHGLSASSGSDRTDCTLANGTTIRVRGGEDQVFSYGMGGANPPAFFSLWINKHKVFSRKEWMPGYQDSFNNSPVYDGVLIDGNQVTICATAEGKPQHCASQPLGLAQTPIDRVEYSSSVMKMPVGSITAIAKGELNQKFCKAYLDLVKPGLESALKGEFTSLNIDWMSPSPQPRRDESFAESSVIELSPGITRLMTMWDGSSHYFDGSVIVIAPVDMKTKDVTAAYSFEDIESWPNRITPSGLTLISGGQKQLYPKVSPRYVHLVPQRIDGTIYILAYPTNQLERPTAALVKPLADGGFFTICAFNRTQAHY